MFTALRNLLTRTRRVDPRDAENDAWDEAVEWAEAHAAHYPDHATRIWGPDLAAASAVYLVGCSAYRCNAEHAAPIGA